MLVDVWILLDHDAMTYIKALKYLPILRLFQLVIFSNRKKILRSAQNDNLCRPEWSEGSSYAIIEKLVPIFTLLFLANTGFSSVLPLLGGTRDDIIKIADNLSKQGRYDEAITEYKRFVFFNPDHTDNSQVFYKIGLAYRAERDWHHALEAMETSIALAQDPEISSERRLSLATTLIASKNYNLAKLELVRILDSTKDNSLSRKALYFNGIVSIYSFDWDATEKNFNDFYNDPNSKSVRELNSTLLRAKDSYKSTTTAKILSTIIPGAGQVYAGNWHDGINAFILNGVIIGFIANSAYKKDYRDALLITFLLSYRYYKGNIYNAGKDVEKYNNAVDLRTAKESLKIVSPDEP
jgi:tetratricopeptide (TPR) repeat protein